MSDLSDMSDKRLTAERDRLVKLRNEALASLMEIDAEISARRLAEKTAQEFVQ